MLRDLIAKAREYGLEVHETKTKILWNGIGRGTPAQHAEMDGRTFEILPAHGSSMYLGRLLSLCNTHGIEIKNRINKAWQKFAIYRKELTDKYYSLKQRLKLFATVVQPTLLYGCGTWTMTRKRETLIRSVQRRMLRSIVGVRRLTSRDDAGNVVLEDWVAWVQRSTHIAEVSRQQHRVAEWVEEITRRKFRWAGHVARRQDGRWTREVLDWSLQGYRAQGRPSMRWTDSLNKFFYGGATSSAVGAQTWVTQALNRSFWQQQEDSYVRHCMGRRR